MDRAHKNSISSKNICRTDLIFIFLKSIVKGGSKNMSNMQRNKKFTILDISGKNAHFGCARSC